MQLAALVAVVAYFWKDVKGVTLGSVSALVRRDYYDRTLRLGLGIVLATIPIVIMGLVLSKLLNQCDSPLRSLWVIGLSCVFMAAAMAVAELACRHIRTVEDMTLRDAIIVGLAQVGALIPGISRSGSTLTAALLLDFKRGEAARFSFLLGLPAIAGAGLKELVVLYRAGLSMEGWMILGFGLIIASVSAFVAIWSLMSIMEKFSTWPFVAYRGTLGIVLLVGVSMGWLV
jgi:undecaprenyl-diphosphatase